MIQSTLPRTAPNIRDRVTLSCGTVGYIGSAELKDPLRDDSYTRICVQWKGGWLFCEPVDLERDGDGWRMR